MNLLFDFAVDKATNTIRITREFAADLDLVWDAFTKAEILVDGAQTVAGPYEGNGLPGRRALVVCDDHPRKNQLVFGPIYRNQT
jgi:hypothetical protein